MKANRLTGVLCFSVVTLVVNIAPNGVLAHEEEVHEQITLHAAASANELSVAYRTFIATIGGPKPLSVNGGPAKTPFLWMIEGSAREDDANKPGDAGGRRPFNHFHDPLSNQGLSDRGPLYPMGLLGRNSVIWASSDAPGLDVLTPSALRNVNTHNDWAWNRVRDYQWLGLTETDTVARERNLAHMFRGMGSIIHLLQDATQPQHVRNEQHLDYIGVFGINFPSPWHSPIEKWGLEHVGELNYTHGMLDWRAAGFKNLKDFWDRDLSTWSRSDPKVRSAQALIDSESSTQPTKRLGLAEFVNGNFIGPRHGYRELFPEENPFHYPYPSLDEGTDWKQLLANPASRKKFTTIPEIGSGYRYIVGKTGAQGIPVTHHGAVTYLVAVNRELGDSLKGLFSSSITSDDPDVLKDYHDILIPKAIEYSAGILDYFFRGQIEVESVEWNGTAYVVTVRNVSGDSLKDGAFTLLKDDPSGNRSPVGQAFTLTGPPLAHNATTEVTFTDSQLTSLTKAVLVYKGNIGLKADNTPNDPVDAGIAIAAKRLMLECPEEALVYIDETITFPALTGCSTVPQPDPINNDFSEMRSYSDVADLSSAFPMLRMWDGTPCPLSEDTADREYTGGPLEFGPYTFDAIVYAATPIFVDDYFTAKLDSTANAPVYTTPSVLAGSIPDGTPLFSVPAGHTVIIQAYEAWGAWCFVSGKLGVLPDGCLPPPVAPPSP